MKRNTFLTLAALLVLVGGGIYLIVRPFPATAPASSIPLTESGSYTDHSTYYDIATNYATTTTLTGTANTAAIAAMQAFVGNTITQFKKDGNFAHLSSEDIAMMQGRKETLQIQYLIASAPHTVSYIFTIYEDTLGAHGNTFFRTFTFDANTGAELSLSDVFSRDTPYLDTLSRLTREKLTTALHDSTMTSFINDGTTPSAQNFQNFFFDNGDFVLLFPPYQVAPYASGPQTVRLSRSELSSILNPTYR